MKIKLVWWISLFVVVACAATSHVAQAADPNGHLYIAHAASGRNISSTDNPEYPVDILIGSYCLAHGWSFGEILGPFTLPPGSYAVKVSVADSANPCSAATVFTGGVGLGAGTTYLGILTLNSSNQVDGQVASLDLSAIPVGESRVIATNTTGDSLTGTLTAGDTTKTVETGTIAAGTVYDQPVTAGEYSATIYPAGSTKPATGPVRVNFESRNVYLFVIAGSTANNSIQLIGPTVIRGVF